MGAAMTNLRSLFRGVAYLEFSYFLFGIAPPSMIEAATGLNLTPDGHWVMKLISVALLTQAHTAWTFRDKPHLEVAKGLAFYQMASATVDWCIWLALKDQGIFENNAAKALVVAAIGSHYFLGGLLWINGMAGHTSNS